MSAIVAENLEKSFRTYRKQKGLVGAVRGLVRREYTTTRAVDGVSFTIEPGELVGFLGPNGAGKTTTLKMLAGLLHPTSGHAAVLGFTPWKRSNEMKRRISLVMGQKNALWWDLPARESLELNRAIYGIPRAEFTRSVDELTDLLGVRDRLDVMVRELSLGQRMKMELIAALLHRPSVMFLDEPTIGLDVVSQQTVREFLAAYNRRARTTILLTSHYMQDIEALCRRVILIDHGKIIFDGPLERIVERFAADKIIAATFGSPTDCMVDDLGHILERSPERIRIQVPRRNVATACRTLLDRADVADLSVTEPPIEDIIRSVFGRE
jgi:ABC-2 type transport system ATP-binding protein